MRASMIAVASLALLAGCGTGAPAREPLATSGGLTGAAAHGEAAPAASASSCRLPADSVFRADVSGLPRHPDAGDWELYPGSRFHPDFGSGTWEGRPFGIPVTTVTASTPPVTVRFAYADESDGGGYRIGPKVRIEGGPTADGDRHALLLNRSTCRLAELYALRRENGRWTAGSGAKWNLRSNVMRPAGWTSADAAGLPIAPLLVSYADVARGDVGHAIRFTLPRTARRYVWPASHQAGRAGVAGPPMGAWFRLRAGVSLAGFGPQSRVIAQAMKKHGVVLADNGSAWYLSGTQDSRWDNDDLSALKRLRGSDFEAVDVSGLQAVKGSYARRR